MSNEETTDRAVESIVKQFRGGEHKLAGQRASQLVFGSARTPNQKLLDRITEAAPGIDRYIVAPDAPAPLAIDEGGNPLATQPENDPNQAQASNLSTDQAKAEQAEIDERLKKGRERAEKAGEEKPEVEAPGETKLNPEGSDKDTTGKPAGKKPGA